MGKNILTTHQNEILELASTDRCITGRYYFTGGTALTAFYLKHRISEDLDFFTESDVKRGELDFFFATHSNKLKITSITREEHYGMLFFYVTFSDHQELKIDFVNFPYRRIESGKKHRALKIDSIFDIALNKLYTIADRARVRDYIDLYCILQSEGISLEQVMDRMNDKFDPLRYDDFVYLGLKLQRIIDLTEYPSMLIPFDKQKMIDFYLGEVKKIGKKIFK